MRACEHYTSLRRRAEFSRVHRQGRRKGDALLQVRVLPHPAAGVEPLPPVRLGIIVSKKFGASVARNRFKRLVRAALRTLAPELSRGWDLLVLPREAQGVTMLDVLTSLRQLLSALGLVKAIAEPLAEEQGR